MLAKRGYMGQYLSLAGAGLLLLASSTVAAPPDEQTLVQRMRDVLKPARASVREVVITMTDRNGEQTVWKAREARKELPDGKRTLLVVLEPEDTKNNALLIWDKPRGPSVEWWYPPALRRVRELMPIESYQQFLDTDFTYADLGFVDRQGAYRLLGDEQLNGARLYKVEFVPDRKVFYSRILTWIAPDTFLPVRRDYYDVAGQLWKRITFSDVTVVDDVPTPLHIRMEDLQQGSHTDLVFRDVRYDVRLPDTIFDPQQLPQTVQVHWWEPSATKLAGGNE
jgi:outer membrane lipoprotein-sorting protein